MVVLYTTEHPARRGLALALTGLAFAGTLTVAWLVADARSGSQTAPTELPALAPTDWPITFDLPPGYAWTMEPTPPGRNPLLGGDSATVAFLGRDSDAGSAFLVVSYAVLPVGVTPRQVAERIGIGGGGWANSEPVMLGPLTGRWGESARRSQPPTLLLAAATPEGLGVAVEFWADGGRWEQQEMFRRFCQSLTFVDWRIEP